MIDYEKRSAVNSEVLADFIADWTEPKENFEGEVIESPWIIFCDGALGAEGARISAVLVSPSTEKLRYAARLEFNGEGERCTNNIAEYEALLLGLRKARALGIKTICIKTVSKVIKGHIEKETTAWEPSLVRCLEEVRHIEKHFKGFTCSYIERNLNSEADQLAKAAAKKQDLPSDVFFETLTLPAIKSQEKANAIHAIASEDWQAPIIAYVKNYYEPSLYSPSYISLYIKTRARMYSPS